MTNTSLYASELTYEFEKQYIRGISKEQIALNLRKDVSIPPNLQYIDMFYDDRTGTSGVAFRDLSTGEIIIAYTGTNPKPGKFSREFFIKDVLGSDLGGIGLGLSQHYKPAFRFYEKIRNTYIGDIVITGHSLGGNIGQVVAIQYNVAKTVIYNPAPLYGIDLPALLQFTSNTSFIEELSIKGKQFTGQIIRFQTRDDFLKNSSDILGLNYWGESYILKDSKGHSLGGIIDSPTDQLDIAREIKNMYLATIDIDGDGRIDINLPTERFSPRNLFLSGMPYG
ncbi:hypothetical protein MKL26_06830, partial [Streptococcus suis]|nr:hypothetical protein [Streptococcus suis]